MRCPLWTCQGGMSWQMKDRCAVWIFPAGGAFHQRHELVRSLLLPEHEPFVPVPDFCCCWQGSPSWPTCPRRSSWGAVCRAHKGCRHPSGSPSDTNHSPGEDSQTQACCQPGLKSWPNGGRWTKERKEELSYVGEKQSYVIKETILKPNMSEIYSINWRTIHCTIICYIYIFFKKNQMYTSL